MFTFGSVSSFSFGYSYSSRRYRHESRPKVLKAGQVTPRLPNEIFQRVVEHLGPSNAQGGLAKLLVYATHGVVVVLSGRVRIKVSSRMVLIV
jgi:hypothetical protein